MLSENNFPSLKKSVPASNNDAVIQKSIVMKYSDVLKQKKTNTINNALKFSEIVEKQTNKAAKTDTLINNISEITEKISLSNKSTVEHVMSKQHSENNKNESNKNNVKQKKEDIQKKYQNNLDSIIKIQTWWRTASKIKSVENIKKNNNKEKSENKENKVQTKENKDQKKGNENVIGISKKPSFSEIVKLASSPTTINNENPSNNTKKQNRRNKRNNNFRNKNNNKNENDNTINNNNNSENKTKENERKNQTNAKKVNEELNAIFKNIKFMGLIEKEVDALTEKNTIVNGKQFAKTKVVTIKKSSRNSSSSNFSIDDIIDNTKENKKKGNKNENKTRDKKVHSKKNVCFNEKDEVFNEYGHVMKKLDLQRRCDKKSCLIDCYRRLYKREWEEDEEVSEDSTSNSESEESNDNSSSPLKKKSDYLYNDIYNPNYTKYYSGSDFDFGNRYFTGKERLKKALHLEPVEVTVQKIIYQPIKFQKNKRFQQKKKNGNKRKQNN